MKSILLVGLGMVLAKFMSKPHPVRTHEPDHYLNRPRYFSYDGKTMIVSRTVH